MKSAIEVSIKSKLEVKSVNELKDMITGLMDDKQDGAGVVFVFALDVLETKISEQEYIEFCDSL